MVLDFDSCSYNYRDTLTNSNKKLVFFRDFIRNSVSLGKDSSDIFLEFNSCSYNYRDGPDMDSNSGFQLWISIMDFKS